MQNGTRQTSWILRWSFSHFTSLKLGSILQLMVCHIFNQQHLFFVGCDKIMVYVMIDARVDLLKNGNSVYLTGRLIRFNTWSTGPSLGWCLAPIPLAHPRTKWTRACEAGHPLYCPMRCQVQVLQPGLRAEMAVQLLSVCMSVCLPGFEPSQAVGKVRGVTPGRQADLCWSFCSATVQMVNSGKSHHLSQPRLPHLWYWSLVFFVGLKGGNGGKVLGTW